MRPLGIPDTRLAGLNFRERERSRGHLRVVLGVGPEEGRTEESERSPSQPSAKSGAVGQRHRILRSHALTAELQSQISVFV